MPDDVVAVYLRDHRGMAQSPKEADALELVVFAQEGVTRHRLPADGRLTIGRGDGNDVRVEDVSASRQHAVLHVSPALAIEDLGASNATVLRRREASASPGKTVSLEPIPKRKERLRVGDVVTIGTTSMVLRRVATRAPGAGVDALVRDPAMAQLYDHAARAAGTTISVLVLGETGSGKEVLARTLHERSPRADKRFVGLNCAAFTESLLEAELFGHEKGAYTGATEARAGLLEAADGGTVFLDEVGELSAGMQAKLLRVLEDRKVLRVGGREPKSIDVRFIAATNRDLERASDEGTFRSDLFYRLNGISLTLPPLRSRPSEIRPLAELFLSRAVAAFERPTPLRLSDEAADALARYRWPGNVRELRNTMERAAVLALGDEVLAEHLPAKITDAAPVDALARDGATPSAAGDARSKASLRAEIVALERSRMEAALAAHKGNQTKAALAIGMPRRTFVAKLKEHGLGKPSKTRPD